MWQGSLSRALDVVFPRSCLGCDEPISSGEGWDSLCPRCVRRLDWIHPPYCETCGHPFSGIGTGQACSHCELLEPVYASGRCCLLHRDLGAEIVRELKYRDARYLGADMRRIARQVYGLADFVRDAVFVPVPLHPARERERGFNQSTWLAGEWARVLPVRGVEALLIRARWTGTQTRLDRSHRGENVRGAFALCPGAEVSADLTYVLVDDVFTTGSTLNECCRTLLRAGAGQLKVLTLAHG